MLIRNNNATDLCITRGQEARVVRWTSQRMQLDHHRLEVIYAELIKPPHGIYVPNLPKNMVPLTRPSETVEARLSTDEYLYISCSHCCQEKTPKPGHKSEADCASLAVSGGTCVGQEQLQLCLQHLDIYPTHCIRRTRTFVDGEPEGIQYCSGTPCF